MFRYFAVSWFEPRLRINKSASEWTEDRTGPLNVNISSNSENNKPSRIQLSQLFSLFFFSGLSLQQPYFISTFALFFSSGSGEPMHKISRQIYKNPIFWIWKSFISWVYISRHKNKNTIKWKFYRRYKVRFQRFAWIITLEFHITTIILYPGSERVAWNFEIHLVSRAGDLRPRHLWPAESVEGNVRGEDQQEQDDHLRARGPDHNLLQDELW